MLRDLGIPFSVVPSHAEEVLVGKNAASLAETNALAKVKGAALPDDLPAGAFVLGTDTLVTLDGRVMGKPSSADDAAGMLGALSDRTHEVISGVALARTAGPSSVEGFEDIRVASAVTSVRFLPLELSQIAAYLACGEWKGKAGAYAIQGVAGLFVSEVRGEYSNVVGLPLCLLARLFRESGLDLVRREWRRTGGRGEIVTGSS